ncbi:unnamed protein product [Prunus armeniaca]
MGSSGCHERVGVLGSQFGYRSCRIQRIVKRNPGYSGNANHRVKVLVTVRSCDRERSDRPIWTKLAGRVS